MFQWIGNWMWLVPLLWLTGCGGGSEIQFCFGSDEFCSGFFAANEIPIATAGPDFEATSGNRVELDGSGSRDDDGSITNFSWVQLRGEPVAIINGGRSVASFDAPLVDIPTELVFRLTVTDSQDASDQDTVQITVIPRSMAAVAVGLALLKNEVPPKPLIPAPGAHSVSLKPAVERGFVGLWMIVRIVAFERQLDLEPAVLLDELRAVMQFEQSVQIDIVESIERLLYAEGLQRLRSFATQHDPATSDLADQQLAAIGAAGEIASTGGWLAIDATESRIVVKAEASDDVFAHAIETLLGQSPPTDPIEIANATRVILLERSLTGHRSK